MPACTQRLLCSSHQKAVRLSWQLPVSEPCNWSHGVLVARKTRQRHSITSESAQKHGEDGPCRWLSHSPIRVSHDGTSTFGPFWSLKSHPSLPRQRPASPCRGMPNL